MLLSGTMNKLVRGLKRCVIKICMDNWKYAHYYRASKKQISGAALSGCGTCVASSSVVSGKICCICQDFIKKKERFVSFPTFDSKNIMIPGMPIHSNCFFKYMTSQIQDKKRDYEFNIYDQDTVYENYRTFLRCPMRNMINFHVDNIVPVIDKYLNRNTRANTNPLIYTS